MPLKAHHKDFQANVMDYSANAFLICQTITDSSMSFLAEFMHVLTVILLCDIALLWRINFSLKLCQHSQLSFR
ncbi:hypothetical protein DP033_08005 [Escherichia coli]|nr:hypothetical protein [Escherichia coli]PSZ17468.1 hypothetical protein C7B04_10825 [Escherichia sp. 4726-5]PTN28282.1 hypothetical protein A7589_03905 [Escherichia sp. MOD1-EC6475]